MIFERAVRREFAQAAAGISVALFAILASIMLIRLLKDAAGGRIAPEAVATLLGFTLLNFTPLLLTLMLFVAILLTLSRAYRDSEMVVWFSSGLPLTAWIRPVMRFALPIVLAIAGIAGFLSPWGNFNAAQLKEVLSARSDVSNVAPGVFRESKGGQKVFFVESIAEDSTRFGNVFVASMQDDRLGVMMSGNGYQESVPNGDRFVVLESGRRYEVEPGSPAFKVMSFERYRVRTEDGVADTAERLPSRMSISELLSDWTPSSQGEFLWRIGIPVSAMILALLAIPLSYVNPRAGRSANMLIAILIDAIYSNLLWVSQAWVSQGRLSFWIGVWAIHALMLLPLIFLFYRRIAIGWPWTRRR